MLRFLSKLEGIGFLYCDLIMSPEKKVGVRRPLLVKNSGSQNENFESALGRKIDMARSAKIFGGYFGDLVLDLVCILSFSTFLQDLAILFLL